MADDKDKPETEVIPIRDWTKELRSAHKVIMDYLRDGPGEFASRVADISREHYKTIAEAQAAEENKK